MIKSSKVTRDREFKDRLYKQLVRVAQAIDNPHRLELMDLLAQGEHKVEDLAGDAALSVANASHHLQVLRRAGLVEPRRQGVRVYYRLAEPQVHEVARAVHGLAERRLAEIGELVNTYLVSRDELEPVQRDELLRRMRSGRAVVADVRPVEEYRAGHVVGAFSMPVDLMHKRLVQLPTRKEIVVYSRGRYCVMAYEAVARLRARGRRAWRLADGFPEWRAAGLPVETSV